MAESRRSCQTAQADPVPVATTTLQGNMTDA